MNNQLTADSNESLKVAQGVSNVPSLKFKLDLRSALAAVPDDDNGVGSSFKVDTNAKRMSDDSLNSQGGGFFSRIKSKFTSVMNSARRSSFNVGDSCLTSGASASAAITDRPNGISRTISGNPFLAAAEARKP